MSFAEVRFPVNISYGSKGGPMFSTVKNKRRSGVNEPVARWAYPLFHYDARWGIHSDADLRSCQEFVIARLGPFEGFRWKDFLNYSTDSAATMDASTPAFDDVVIGVGDGTTTNFQLVMKWTSGVVTRTKNIYKPVAGTVKSGIDGVEKTITTDFTIDTTTGILTYNTAPGAGLDVTAGFDYDLPCRFGEEMDTEFFLSIDDFRSGSIPSIPVVEEHSPEVVTESFFMGGSDDLAYSADISVSPLVGRAIRLVPASGGLKVQHPDTTDLEEGGAHFYWQNDGAVSTILAEADGTTIATLAAGAGATMILIDVSGTKTWYALG